MLPALFDPETELYPRTRGAWGSLSRDLDRMVERLFEPVVESVCTPYRVDMWEDQGHFYIEADMPGFTKDNIDVSVENGVLTISGERKEEGERKEAEYYLRERRHGKFERQFRLPQTVNPDEVHANLRDGLLTITLNKSEESKPKKITVNEKA